MCGLGQDSSPGSYPKLRPWLGSYEGCSFICSPLRLGETGQEVRYLHQKLLLGYEKLGEAWWRKVEETDRKKA